MGSAASPALRGVQARALLSEIERLSRESIATSGEIDVTMLADVLDTHLDNLRERQALMRYLAAYLSRCVTKSMPDYRVWSPPE